MKNLIEESRGILNLAEKLVCQQMIILKSRPKIKKGWWLNGRLRARQKEKNPSPIQNYFQERLGRILRPS